MKKQTKAKLKLISPKVVEHVAHLARLEFSDKEIKEMGKDLNNILAAFRKMDKAPINKIEPSFHPTPMKDVYRDDNIEKCFSPEEALGNTSHRELGFFKGPKAV